MKSVKIFLAASSELMTEKKEIESTIHQLNKKMMSQNIYLELFTWEESIDFMTKTPLIGQFRENMLNCEIFISLFFSRIGKYTTEEFENALERFNSGSNPQYIFTYFKNDLINLNTVSKEDILRLYTFKEKIQQLGHAFTEFTNTSQLIIDVTKHLERILISNKPLNKKNRDNIFISYSHKNKKWLNELLIFLKPLQKKGLIKVWSDKEIELGSKWNKEIKNALEQAKVGLLLITQDFLASDFITNEEIPRLIQSSQEEGAIILPVILEPCTIQYEEELNEYQFFNSPDNPISSLSENEKKMEFVRLSNALIKLFEK